MSSSPTSAPKQHRFGTHRVSSPSVTLDRVSAIARSFGITRVANITGLDVIGIPVVSVVRPNSRSLAVAQGKGVDLIAAKVSGLMESIENYHAENIRKPLRLESERQIRAQGGRVIDVDGLPRVAGGIYDSDARFLWVEGHEILGRERAWLPFEVVHADYVVPLASNSGAFLLSDSGVASGNHVLEATSHAICELVERDANTLWHYRTSAEKASSRIDLDGVDDAACRWALTRFAAAGVAVGVWEVTSDVGIPSFLCLIADHSPDLFRPLGAMFGSGCHPCREVALFRALSEAAQSRLTVISGSRDDLGLAVYRRGLDLDEVAKALATTTTSGARPFSSVPTFDGDSIEEDVAWELEQLKSAGIAEVVAVDLTLKEFGIPVVRVVIPGLESMCDAPGFVPGRRLRTRLT
ncbi:MAG: YcaO-like family protein [Pseudomonadota bacterium]